MSPAPLAAENLSAGPLGLLVVLLLVVATVLLIRNMNARLRRLPPRFEDQEQPERREDPAGS
ncbi:MAG TPA: hypothetical protein VNA30_03780 [Mycobacteriales bacterium]|nr:hypothetical protein [Mycobacteriales bacterium]